MKKIQYICCLLLLPIFMNLINPILQTEKQIALVIGNEAYSKMNHTPLKNPKNDANQMEKVLEFLNFEVTKKVNLNQKQMEKALENFHQTIKQYNAQNYKVIALFYFSGHGTHYENTSYLIPLGAKPNCPTDLKYETINLNQVLERLELNQSFLNLVMIDACRNNIPNKQRLLACLQEKNPDKGLQDDLFEGMSEPEMGNKAHSNMYISFATAPKTTADLGDKHDSVSPYVRAFLESVQKPNLSLHHLIPIHISQKVKRITHNAQRPWYKGSFDHDFIFKNYLPEMVYITGGTFQMGSKNGLSNEKPVHQVNVKGFYMGKYEITIQQFAAFIKDTNYKTDAERLNSSYIRDNGDWTDKEGINWRHDVTGQLRSKSAYNHPVIHVSWNDAKAYCDWLSQKTNQTYTLPTEAEWEYAAGNGEKHTTYSWGNEINTKNMYGSKNGYIYTAPIGKFKANDFELHDMSGNVWEWCLDTWHRDYTNAPKNGTAWIDEENMHRAFRGGSWYFGPRYCRVASRSMSYANDRYSNLGFRVARH